MGTTRALVMLVLSPLPAQGQETGAATALRGTWVGYAVHRNDSALVALALTARDDGTMVATLSVPTIHVREVPIGQVRRDGATVHLGPIVATWDSGAGTLTGVLPAAFVPVHSIPFTLRRGEPPAFPARPRDVPTVTPAWTVDVGAPIWSDLGADGDFVFVGADDGRLHALDARTGAPRWTFQAGGAIRARPTVIGDALFVHADDGLLYRLDPANGAERWRIRTTTDSIVRVPPPTSGSRWDTRGSAVASAGGRLFVGSHDGRVLALDPRDGTVVWAFATGGSVVATPGVSQGRVLTGSFDGKVYALEASTGHLLWTHDTGAPVTSTPVPVGDVVVAGSRSYDLIGLDAATGAVRWNRYVWFSWIESTPAVASGVAYVGSSDAALIMAVEVTTGRAVWDSDVLGASWGTPILTEGAVVVGTRAQAGAITHAAAVVALDRASGVTLWRFTVPMPEGARFAGFAGSGAHALGRVFFAAVDGRVYAFESATQ